MLAPIMPSAYILALCAQLSLGAPQPEGKLQVDTTIRWPDEVIRAFNQRYKAQGLSAELDDDPRGGTHSDAYLLRAADMHMARSGSLRPLDRLWADEGLSHSMRLLRPLVSVRGIAYAVPYAFSAHKGLIVRTELLRKYKQPLPRTYPQLLKLCEGLKAEGLTPIAYSDPGKLFDALALAEGGYGFYKRMTRWKIPVSDRRIRAVLQKWSTLIERGCLSREKTEADLYKSEAVMLLADMCPRAPKAFTAQDRAFIPFPASERLRHHPLLANFVAAAVKDEASGRGRARALSFVRFLAQAKTQGALADRVFLPGDSCAPPARSDAQPQRDFIRASFEALSEDPALKIYPVFDHQPYPGVPCEERYCEFDSFYEAFSRKLLKKAPAALRAVEQPKPAARPTHPGRARR